MSVKDVLVHIDSARPCQARLRAALGLATRHDAHLTGLYVKTRPQIPGYLRAQLPDDLLQRQESVIEEYAARAEAMFNENVQRAGVNGEWRCVEGLPLAVIGLHGRYDDIVIVGQKDPAGEDGIHNRDMPDQLILSVGRPVLVVPHNGEFPVIGERIMVAWDASRLAARAVNDALPLLEAAKQVGVLAVNPKIGEGERRHGDIPSADICLHLARHGVSAQAQQMQAEELGVGPVLLSRAVDEGADLIVCGAYGHARWREIVLGGVTRHLLSHTSIPVLMSH